MYICLKLIKTIWYENLYFMCTCIYVCVYRHIQKVETYNAFLERRIYLYTYIHRYIYRQTYMVALKTLHMLTRFFFGHSKKSYYKTVSKQLSVRTEIEQLINPVEQMDSIV